MSHPNGGTVRVLTQPKDLKRDHVGRTGQIASRYTAKGKAMLTVRLLPETFSRNGRDRCELMVDWPASCFEAVADPATPAGPPPADPVGDLLAALDAHLTATGNEWGTPSRWRVCEAVAAVRAQRRKDNPCPLCKGKGTCLSVDAINSDGTTENPRPASCMVCGGSGERPPC